MRLEVPVAQVDGGSIHASVLYVDRFGNMQLNLTRDDLESVGVAPGTRFELEVAGERYYATAARTFADARPGEIVLYEDSYRNIAIAINRGARGRDVHGARRTAADAAPQRAVNVGQRFARLVTDVTVRQPRSGGSSAARRGSSSTTWPRSGMPGATRRRSRRSRPRSRRCPSRGACSTSGRAPARSPAS